MARFRSIHENKRRGSFGFRNINGKAIKLTVTKKTSNGLMTKDAPQRLQSMVAAAMNRAGRAARNRAKKKDWTPKKTGALIDSIRWRLARVRKRTGSIVSGRLVAGNESVLYARRQEYEHATKSRFLFRAIEEIGRPHLIEELKQKGILVKVVFGSERVAFG